MDELRQRDNNGTETNTWEAKPYRRAPVAWGRIAVLLIILGAVLFAAGWALGSRGGRVYFENGLHVTTVPTGEYTAENIAETVVLNENVHTIRVNGTSNAIHFVPTTDRAARVQTNNRNVIINEANGVLDIRVERAAERRFRGGIFNVGNLGVTWNRAEGRRFLEYNFDFGNISFENVNNAIRVYVPEHVRVIDARSTSGRIRLENVNTAQLSLSTTSGSINIDGGINENARFQTTSGSVRANGYFNGNIYARTTSGGINIEHYGASHPVADSIQLSSTSGTLRFATNAPLSDFSYNLSVTSGSMRVNEDRLSGRNVSGGRGNISITARATSGSIRLNFGR
jgi:hypothetical protein